VSCALTRRSDASSARSQSAMSSEVIARVLVFYRKALELDMKGHNQRAAENYSRAVEAARALGADNLVVADMQRCQAVTLMNYAVTVKNTEAAVDPVAVAAYRADSVALHSAAMAALERRRVAGTLLEGKCTAAEEAWCAAKFTEAGKMSEVDAAAWAPLVGYDIYLLNSQSVLYLLVNAWSCVGECSATQLRAFAQFVVHAADLMQQPRSHSTMYMGAEVNFVEAFSTVMALDLGARGLDASLVQLLTDAWLRLQRSGVLETRGVHDGIRRDEQITASDRDEHAAAIRTAMAAPGLRSCALPGCGAKEAHPKHFKRCSACQAVVYCSKEHQLEAWPAHKAACKAARKAKAASSDGGAGPGAAS